MSTSCSRRCGSPRARRSPISASSQDAIHVRGAALQCRITTEDPWHGFRPDTGRITTYRSPGGAGIRLDGGTVNAGVYVSPHFDSMLAKMTARGPDFPSAVTRAKRGLAEFRIRGLATNIPFLQAVLEDPDFVAGRPVDVLHRGAPVLLEPRESADRGTKVITWLANVTVNQPHGPNTERDRSGHQAAGDRPRRAGAAGFTAAAARAGAGRLRRGRCARRSSWRSPTRPSATLTSACWRRGCARATWFRSCRMSRA